MRLKIGGTLKTLLLGCLIGVAADLAVVPWIGVYGTLADTGITQVGREISAVANTFVPFVPYMLVAIGLGIALVFGPRRLSPHQPSAMDDFVSMIAALSTVAVIGAVVVVMGGFTRYCRSVTDSLSSVLTRACVQV
jgi:hypothetical protein